MAAPAGFNDLINRKYDILQQEASDRGALEQANAANITASTPFENALRAAQTRQTAATASTVGPLAQASIAATTAGIGETQARAGLTSAQTGLVGAQTRDITADLAPIGRLGAGYYLDQLRRMGTTYAPPAAPAATGGTPGLSTQTSIVPATLPNGKPQAGHTDENGNYVLGFAKGTAKVPHASGKVAGGLFDPSGALAAAKGASRVPGHGSGRVDTVPAMLAPGEAVVSKAGIKHLPGGRAAVAKANAKGVGTQARGKATAAPPPRAVPHFAAGTPSVPAPGQTQGNGSWGPPAPPSPTPLSPLGQNTGLRLQLGMGKPKA